MRQVCCTIVLLLNYLLVPQSSSPIFSIYIIISTTLTILELLFLLSVPALNLVLILWVFFQMDIKVVITLITVILWFLIRLFLVRSIAVEQIIFSRVKLEKFLCQGYSVHSDLFHPVSVSIVSSSYSVSIMYLDIIKVSNTLF